MQADLMSNAAARRPSSLAAEIVVGAAVLFNAILALVNANVVPINNTAVIGCEILIDVGALVLSFLQPHPLQRRWVILILVLVFINLSNTMGNARFDPKFLRDVMIIPIFALLGVTASRDGLIRLLVWLQVIVLVAMIYEAITPDGFGHVFNVMGYYINTRGFQAEQFWSGDNPDLFVSATRPGERFLFASLGIHRLSSVFLEPVSLGNYCVIATMIMVALWDRIGLGRRIFLVISTFMILVGSDGRFATVSIAIMVLLRFVAPQLPRYFNALYFPVVLVLAGFIVIGFQLSPNGDDFPSRTAGSIGVLSQMGPIELFGYDSAHAYEVMDSGISYLVYSQSLMGAVAIWLLIAIGLDPKDRSSIIFSHATSIYVILNLLISYSVFSVKTAGLLWFAFGAMGRLVEEEFGAQAKPEAETRPGSGRRRLAGERREVGVAEL